MSALGTARQGGAAIAVGAQQRLARGANRAKARILTLARWCCDAAGALTVAESGLLWWRPCRCEE